MISQSMMPHVCYGESEEVFVADIDAIFNDICGLPIRDRLQLVERIVRELSTSELTETRQDAGAKLLGLFAEDPEGVDEMMKGVMETRRGSTLRIVEDDGAKSPA
jgi:hypothetical protein